MVNKKLCPSCRSPYIGIWLGAEAGVLYRCNECGYQGPIVLEEDSNQAMKSKTA
jgi:phage-related protein